MKEIPGLQGYFADAHGHVHSNRSGLMRQLAERWHKGYLHVQVRLGSGRKTQRKLPVHALVLQAWRGARPDGQQCRHLDGDRSNNCPSNLKWGTAAENMADAVRHGTAICIRRGAAHPRTKLSVQAVSAIRTMASSRRQVDLAAEFGCSQRHVSAIVRGESRGPTPQGG